MINLISDYVEDEKLQLEKFLKKYEKPIWHTLKKFAVIGSAKDFDQALMRSEVISITNLHRLCS